jgi:LmbE family N-acetylglucosaminyl deacetylase
MTAFLVRHEDGAGALRLLHARSGGPCLVLSPHLDDAVLSCASFLSGICPQRPVTVVTLFTEAGKRLTMSARMFARQCGFRDVEDLYRERRAEDSRAIGALGAVPVHLGLPDALFRQRPSQGRIRRRAGQVLPELSATYPTYRRHVSRGILARNDQELLAQACGKVRELVPPAPAVVLAPLAVGSHVDHVFTRRLAETVASDQLVFYLDMPYGLGVDTAGRAPDGYVPVRVDSTGERKRSLVMTYRTQVRPMFGEAVPELPEVLFLARDQVRFV